MSSIKSKNKKMRLSKATRMSKKLPQFVIIRTKGRVAHNRNSRNWRTEKLGIED